MGLAQADPMFQKRIDSAMKLPLTSIFDNDNICAIEYCFGRVLILFYDL